MNIHFTANTSNDIDEIVDYIAKDSYSIAEKFIFKLINYIYYLLIFPEMGTLLSNTYQIRKLIYHNYIIIYQLNYYSNTINIIKILNSKQDINLILKHIKKYIV